MTALVDLADYQAATGSSENPAAQMFALDAASQQVLDYCDRDFGTSDVTEARTFKYDGKGILEIDDAEDIQTVSGQVSGIQGWMAMKEGPASVPVYSYLLLPRLQLPLANEMAFSSNQDAAGFLFRARAFPYIDVEVTATWGWPVVPANVKQAVIITAQEYQRSDQSGGSGDLASKSVAEVAESYYEPQFQSQTSAIQGLPSGAADILWPYKRHSL